MPVKKPKYTKYNKSNPVPPSATFITFPQVMERWGGVSHMFVERRLKQDPNFPKVHRIGRLRLFRLDDLEQYERASVTSRSSSREVA